MGHKKDIARARAGKPHRQEPEEPRYACPFPFCGKPFSTHPDTPDCCDFHRRMIAEHVFLHEHVHVRKRASGLSVPSGNPQVDAALQEMRQKAAREGKG